MTPATSPKIEMRSTQSVTIDVVNDAFRNKGLTAHTFTVYDRGIDVVLDRGEQETVTIQPPTGSVTWRFLCRFHDAGGMHGGVSFGRPPAGRVGPP